MITRAFSKLEQLPALVRTPGRAEAESKGRWARARGMHLEMNPYMEGTVLWAWWRRGWIGGAMGSN